MKSGNGAIATAGCRRHAIVIGGSMAGLCAARILTDHFARVTVIDRDRFPKRPEQRKGTPQTRHAHILLARGQCALARLFPDLDTELAAAGAPLVDWAADCLSVLPSGPAQRYRSHLITRTCTRERLEWGIRRRLAADPRIQLREGCEIQGLMPDERGMGIAGVRLGVWGRARADRDEAETLHADLVVDASGRDSQAPAWLATLGYVPARETVVNSFLGYATRCYRRPLGFGGDWQALLVGNAPPHQRRSGVIYPVEDGRWIVTLAGAGRDYPPTDETGFLEFARGLSTPLVYEAIKDAQPLSPIWGYRRTENRLRHYERLGRWPERFVVLGDAVCTFNPVYGQGMTASALGALALADCLEDQWRREPDGDLTGLARRFQRQLARTNKTPWLLATGEDYRWSETAGGHRGHRTRIMHRYLDCVFRLVPQDRAVQQLFLEVLHLLKPPVALFHPRIVARVARGSPFLPSMHSHARTPPRLDIKTP